MSRDITAAPPIPADQRHAYGPDPSQFLDLFLPPRAQPSRACLVMIHGGFWRAKYDLAHASHLCSALATAGFSVASLEYRRVGNGGGWPASFEDVRTGLAAARTLFAAPPILIGHSAGGHLALLTAAHDEHLKAVVALAPVADLQLAYDLHLSNNAIVDFLGGTPAERADVYAAADPARHASRTSRTLIHGTHDEVVPLALSHSFMRQRSADAGRVELLEPAAAKHFDLIDPASQAW